VVEVGRGFIPGANLFMRASIAQASSRGHRRVLALYQGPT
jgi:hypothetical protein